MKLDIIIKILFIFILIGIVIYVIKVSKTLRLSNRIDKYTINNKDNSISIGDYFYNLYLIFKDKVFNIIKDIKYIKNKSKYYNKFNNNGLDIIATKICISIILSFIYIIYSILEKNFNLFILIIIVIISYYIYNIILNINEIRRKKLIEEDLLRAIVIMNNAFKSGYNITQAVDMVVRDLTGPISDEFNKISNDLKYGLEIKDVFDRFYDRVKIEDIKYITSSLALLNITGGNLVGIFTNIEKSFTNNKRLKDELNSMTASSKLVYYVLLVMPIFLISVLLMISPDYFKPLLSNIIGYFIILLVIVLYISYIVIIKHILKVDYE